MRNIKSEEREYFGNSAAGFLFVCRDKVLLLHRSNEVYEPLTWGGAGGKIEHGEKPEKAAHRESQEELGKLPKYKIVDKYVFKDGKFTYTTFIVLVDRQFKPKLNWENTDYKWATKKDLKQLKIHFGLVDLLKHKDIFSYERI